MRKPLVIYHGPGCMDGMGAALAAVLHFGAEGVELRAAHYDDPPPTPEEVRDRKVYLLDFSYPRPVLDRLYTETDGRLMVIDHHRTAQVACHGLPYCHFNLDHSGAVLAWEYFHSTKPVPDLFRYIEDRDLWRWALPESKEISAALAAYGCGDDLDTLQHHYETWESPVSSVQLFMRLASDGGLLRRAARRNIDRIVALAEEVVLDGHVGLAASCPLYISEAGEALAEKSGTFGALWFRDGARQRFQVSLRSRSGFDVAAIAEKWPGGGGHAQAAAFSAEMLPWLVVGAAQPVRCETCSSRRGGDCYHPPGFCLAYAPTTTQGGR